MFENITEKEWDLFSSMLNQPTIYSISLFQTIENKCKYLVPSFSLKPNLISFIELIELLKQSHSEKTKFYQTLLPIQLSKLKNENNTANELVILLNDMCNALHKKSKKKVHRGI